LVSEIFHLLNAYKYGLMSKEKIPSDIKNSYEFLIINGYNRYIYDNTKIELLINRCKKIGMI